MAFIKIYIFTLYEYFCVWENKYFGLTLIQNVRFESGSNQVCVYISLFLSWPKVYFFLPE